MLVYVDKTELGDSTTYNPATRLNTGGAARKYYTIKSAVDYIASLGDGGGHMLSIRSGVHNGANDYVYLYDTDHSNLVLNCDDSTTVNPSSVNAALRTETAAATPEINGGYFLSTVARNAYYSGTGGDATFNGCIFETANGTGQKAAAVAAGTKNFNGCGFYNRYTGTNGGSLILTGSASANLHACVAGMPLTDGQGEYSGVSMTSSGTLNIVHSIIGQGTTHSGLFANNGTTTIKNSVVHGGNISASPYAINKTGAAIVHAENNFLIAGMADGGDFVSTVLDTDVSNIKTNANPYFLGLRGGIISVHVDDTGGLAYIQSLESELSTHGFKGTWFINTVGWNHANNEALRDLVQGGIIEIGCHTTTHSDMSLSGAIFTVTKGTETITIDRIADTITLSGGGSVSGFKSKSLATLKTELEALGATVTPDAKYNTGSALAGTIKSTCLGEVIADVEAGNSISILVDTTVASGYYKAEMADCKTFIENNIIGEIIDPQTGYQYECRSLGYPFNVGNTNSRTASMAAGFESGRYNTGNEKTYNNSDIDLYSIWNKLTLGFLTGDGSEASVRRNAKAVAYAVVSAGLFLTVLSHNTTECTIEQWGWVFDEWSNYPGLTVTSQQIAVDYLRSIMADDGDGTLSKTWDTFLTGKTSNTSPCIDAGAWITGVNDTGEADPWGNYVHRLPNIGADQGAGSPGSVAIVFNMEAS